MKEVRRNLLGQSRKIGFQAKRIGQTGINQFQKNRLPPIKVQQKIPTKAIQALCQIEDKIAASRTKAIWITLMSKNRLAQHSSKL